MNHDFKTAYDILQNNAQALQNSQQPNIDELMAVVAQPIAAYKVCQSRMDAVEQALTQAFDNNQAQEQFKCYQ